MKNQAVETIQDYVNRIAKKKGYNHEDIAARAKKKGFKISAGYVNNMMHGYASNPSISLGKALTAGLGEPEDDVFAVLRGLPIPENPDFQKTDFYTLWEDFKDSKDETKKQRVLTLIEMAQREITSKK